MQYLCTIFSMILSYLIRRFTPCIDSIVSDIQRKSDQLNRLIDIANDEALAQTERRAKLRSQIDETYAAERACLDEACRASVLRDKLQNLINA